MAFVPSSLSDAAGGAHALSPAGLAFLKHEEGIVPYTYTDSAGYPTFGLGLYLQTDELKAKYGKYTKSNPAPDSVVQASIQEALASRTRQLNSMLKVPVTQSMWDALFSFAYNRGFAGKGFPSVIAEINSQEAGWASKAAGYIVAAQMFELNPNIKARRLREAALFSGSSTAQVAAEAVENAAKVTTSPWTWAGAGLLTLGGLAAYRRAKGLPIFPRSR